VTSDPVAAAARAAAARLGFQHGPDLAVDVETALHSRGGPAVAGALLRPGVAGSLIVSIASLAWSIYLVLK
jgi:hypothetical protein